MKICNNKYGVILSTPGLIIIIALVIFPVVILFFTSLLRCTSIYPVKFTGFENYEHIFNDRLFWLALRKIAMYAGGVITLTFVWGTALALLTIY